MFTAMTTGNNSKNVMSDRTSDSRQAVGHAD